MSSRYKDNLSKSYVDSRLVYCPLSGELRWRASGKIAGYTCTDGYRAVCISYSLYKSHRLAWLLTYGEWPNSMLDHINGDRADNRIGNLRLSNSSENGLNLRGSHSDARVGSLGVTYHYGKYMSRLVFQGKTFHLGYFKTEQEAADAYTKAKQSVCNGSYEQVNMPMEIEV